MPEACNFIEQIIEEDLASGKIKAVQTRFPPGFFFIQRNISSS